MYLFSDGINLALVRGAFLSQIAQCVPISKLYLKGHEKEMRLT